MNTNEDIIKIVLDFINRNNINRKDFASLMGFNNSYIYQILNGRYKPSKEFIRKFNTINMYTVTELNAAVNKVMNANENKFFIKKLFIEKNKTQEEFATIYGYSLSNVNNILNGYININTDFINNVCEFLALNDNDKEKICDLTINEMFTAISKDITKYIDRLDNYNISTKDLDYLEIIIINKIQEIKNKKMECVKTEIARLMKENNITKI